MKKHYLVVLLLILTAIALFPSQVLAQNIDPQYIFVRKDPMSCHPNCSYTWNFNYPNFDFYPGIIDVYNKVGTHGNDQRKLGIGVQILYNEYDFDNVKQSLRSLLNYSKVHSVPIFLSLDGFQWWGDINQWTGRPDLWNWWEQNSPGYNPENKNNVEWTCGISSCAIDKSWRDWGGGEFEVRPQPNLASRAFIESNKQRLSELIPIIVNWYNNNLSAEKKWLFGGITLGIEVDIGGNYYYPSGGITNRQQLGYSALNTLELSDGITTTNLNEIIRRYLNELDKSAFDLGIARNKIFNHTGGKEIAPNKFTTIFPPDPPQITFSGVESSLSSFAYPGWTFYDSIANNPSISQPLSSALDKINGGEWASPEWATWAGDYNGWLQALRNSLNYRNNRFINISNWENIRDKQFVLNALNTVLSESPSCWVTSPVLNTPSINGGNVTLSWQNGENNVATYLNASTVGDFNPSGTLKNMNVINAGVTGTTYNLSNLSPGKYYWAVVADGCSPVQRRIANGKFEIGTPPTPTPTPLPVPGDLNHNSKVNISDYSLLVNDFGKSGSPGFLPADIDTNGTVDIFDYNILMGNFGK